MYTVKVFFQTTVGAAKITIIEAKQEVAKESKETLVKNHKRKSKTTLEEKLKERPIVLPNDKQILLEYWIKLEVNGKESIRHELEYILFLVKVKKFK